MPRSLDALLFDRATGKERRVMLQTITSSESYIILAVFVALALVALIYLLSPMSLPDEPLLYLIGVNHAVQFKSAIAQMFGQPADVGKKRAEFTAHVAEMIDTLGIEVLAEEFSEETKRKSDVREKFGQTAVEQFSWETVLEQFSKVKDIEHRFCDPDTIEKQALGIEVDPQKETESDRDKRERVWLCRIADCKYRRVLFVCGNNHYDAFAQLLESNGFNVQRGAHYDISEQEFHDNADNVIETHEHKGDFKEW